MSNARERLVYRYLKHRTSVFTEHLRLLHIAPERHLEQTLRQVPGIQYVSADLARTRVSVRLDIMMLPFPDDSFDLIICNHVLEHVSDDKVAMRELRRVLRPGRRALLQVPIGRALEDTLEDPTAVTEADRIRLFGQPGPRQDVRGGRLHAEAGEGGLPGRPQPRHRLPVAMRRLNGML
jgi:SAM-dependent methyltransferase